MYITLNKADAAEKIRGLVWLGGYFGALLLTTITVKERERYGWK